MLMHHLREKIYYRPSIFVVLECYGEIRHLKSVFSIDLKAINSIYWELNVVAFLMLKF
jgi:hypothetical protein